MVCSNHVCTLYSFWDRCLPLKPGLAVAHAANLCTICTSLKFTDPELCYWCCQYGSIFVTFCTASPRKAISVRWCVTVAQGHSRSSILVTNYQSKVRMRRFIILKLHAGVQLFPRYNDLLVENLRFSPFYPPSLVCSPRTGVPLVLESVSKILVSVGYRVIL